MTPERWQKVEQLFEVAIERESGAREVFLKAECGGDDALRAEIESLLASDEEAESFHVASPYATNKMTAKCSRESLVGCVISHYRVLRELGRGGMGMVYLAQDLRLRRYCALKLLSSSETGDDACVRRFEQEALAASAVNHPNIVTTYEIGEFRNNHFIAMEFVEGVTLRQQMSARRTDMYEILNIVIQIASALALTHIKGIIHRDVKPENVMLRADGIVKVLDFGVAKLIEPLPERFDSELTTLPRVNTVTGAVFGTSDYMSPEQIKGENLDARTDIWSLGVLLYELATGHVPFDGNSRAEVMSAILNTEPAPLAILTSEASLELERIVRKSLAKNREARYRTMKELLVDCEALQQKLTPAFLPQSIIPTDKTRRTTRREITRKDLYAVIGRRRIGVALIVLALTCIVFGAYKLILRGEFSVRETSPPFSTTTVTKIPFSEKVRTSITVSPDGDYVALVEIEQGRQSVRVRKRTLNDVTGKSDPGIIVPPTEASYYGLVFSLDGNNLYYNKLVRGMGELYRVNLQDGISRKILADIDSPITLSPDGSRLAFWRQYLEPERDVMVVADAESGTTEREMLIRKRPEMLSHGGFAWSPDGKRIAFGSGTEGDLRLTEVHLADGVERYISLHKWWSIDQITWLPTSNGLLMVAAQQDTNEHVDAIWHVQYAGGEARRITNDVSNYIGVSVTKDARTLVTVQSIVNSNFYVWRAGASGAEAITDGNFPGFGLSWSHGRGIVYVSKVSGSKDIWVMDADGKNIRALTRDSSDDHSPTATPDGRYVVFVSNRSRNGAYNLWRIDADGGNPRQLTKGSGEIEPHCSDDNKWVVYTSSESGKMMLWKIPIEGGTPNQITNAVSYSPIVSPDSKWVACIYKDKAQGNNAPWSTGVVSIEGGQPMPVSDKALDQIRWRDSRTLTYTKVARGVENVWGLSIRSSLHKQLTDFGEPRIYSYDWARDGATLAVARGGVIRNGVQMTDSAWH